MDELIMQFEYLRRTARFNMVSLGEVMCEAKKRGFTELGTLDMDFYLAFLNEFESPSSEEYDVWLGGLVDEKGGHRMTCPECKRYPMDQRPITHGKTATITYTCPECAHTFEREVSV